LNVAIMLGCIASLPPQQHLRQLARNILGRQSGYPPITAYYHQTWFNQIRLNGPVVSVGLDPMAAPLSGVHSIDGYFPSYPLSYKHAFQHVHNDPLIESWGSKLYATQDSDFCAARALGARYVVSAIPLRSPGLHSRPAPEGVRLYEIAC
jgi:hypothetical protein